MAERGRPPLTSESKSKSKSLGEYKLRLSSRRHHAQPHLEPHNRLGFNSSVASSRRRPCIIGS